MTAELLSAPAGLADAGLPGVELPADLPRYLPADLWRLASGDTSRRGVLLNVLNRLRSVLYLISINLPAHLVQHKLRDPSPGRSHAEWLAGSLLFADVSGFTALSERLAAAGRDGAEQLTGLMNIYFEAMLDVLASSGGVLIKFAGDALLAYFPGQAQPGARQAHWAVNCARRMMATLDSLAWPDVRLSMKIGVSTGPFLSASIGTAARMEYVVTGETVARTMAAEGLAAAGQVVADQATRSCLEGESGVPLAAAGQQFWLLPGRHPDLDNFEIAAAPRRVRPAIPWDTSPDQIVAEIASLLRQVQALAPFLPAELVDAIVEQAQEHCLASDYRSTATVFVNLLGLEALLTSGTVRDAGLARRVLDDYFRAVQRLVARHGGVVSRIDPYREGSKLLILFGAPLAHGDDPLRAVSAMLALGDELAALNDRWRRASIPAGLRQRIGITYGRTFAGQVGSSTRREYTVMGDDVNLAARLMAAAEPGQVLISQRVYDRIVEHYAARPLPPIMVKGKSQPVPIYQPEGPRDDALARRLRGRQPLVGRDEELQRGQAVVGRALAGQGGLLVIQGAIGLGKSRLADELAVYALARDARVLLHACQSYAATEPYGAWIRLVQRLLDLPPAGDAAARAGQLRHKLADLGSAVAAPGVARPLATLLGLPEGDDTGSSLFPARLAGDFGGGGAQELPHINVFDRLEGRVRPAQEAPRSIWQLAAEAQPSRPGDLWQGLHQQIAARHKAGLLRAVTALLARLSLSGPLLIVLDDAQWLDPASVELAEYVGAGAGSQRLLLILVRRTDPQFAPSESGGRATDAGPGQDRGHTIDLGPLAPEAGRALAGRLLGDSPASAGQIDAIQAASDGNPLLIEEMVGCLQRTGHLAPVADAPARLADLVVSRLDGLPRRQRDAAKAASVVGAEFHRGELSRLLPALADDGASRSVLGGLERARLILLLDPGGDSQYGFRQTLIRQVIYEVLPFARRRELHAALADYLEDCYRDDLAPWAALLARHWEAAGQFLAAARCLILAGHQARQRYALTAAADCYQHVLALADQADPASGAATARLLGAQAREGLGDVALLGGEFSQALAAYTSAWAGSGPGPSPALAVKLALAHAACGALCGGTDGDPFATAEAYARQACASDPAPEGSLTPLATLAWLLWRRGDAESAAWHARAGQTAKPAGAYTGGVLALLADLAGDWAAARQVYQDLDSLPAWQGAVLAICRLGDRQLAAGLTEEAVALYRQAGQAAGREGDACGLALSTYRLAEARLRQGDGQAAGAALREALALLPPDQALAAGDGPRLAIEQALARVRAGDTGPWPLDGWQRYDDLCRVMLLFRP